MARRVQKEAYRNQNNNDDLNNNEDLDDVSEDDDLYGAEDANAKNNQNNGKTKNDNAGGDEVDDLINYKGIYYNDDSGQKYTDPENGAHFEFKDMCKRLQNVQRKREMKDQQKLQLELQEQQSTDPQQTLQKEKEEFLKSLGITQNNNKSASQMRNDSQQQQYQQVQQQRQQQTGPIPQFQQQYQGISIFPQQAQTYAQPPQFQQNPEGQASFHEQQRIAQLIAQQQQQQQNLIQQQILQQNKWRSKSSEKQILQNKMTRQIKPPGGIGIDVNQNQLQKLIALKQQHNEMVMRGKTPENLKQIGIAQKTTLGYNENLNLTSSQNQYQFELSQTQELPIQNIRRSSQKSTRDRSNNNNNNNGSYVQNSQAVYLGNSGGNNSQTRNIKQPTNAATFYKRMQNQDTDYGKSLTNKSQTIHKAGMMPEIDSQKFNNSLAIQNIGAYLNSGGNKSRNLQGTFKTTASVGSTKGNNKAIITNTQGFFEGNGIKGQPIKTNKIMLSGGTTDHSSLIGSHVKKGSNKFNQTIVASGISGGTNANLYQMIYNNNNPNNNNPRQQNLVSNYLKGVDSQIKSNQNKAMSSSRNQTLVAPAGTKKTMIRNALGGTIDDAQLNKSLPRYY